MSKKLPSEFIRHLRKLCRAHDVTLFAHGTFEASQPHRVLHRNIRINEPELDDGDEYRVDKYEDEQESTLHQTRTQINES